MLSFYNFIKNNNILSKREKTQKNIFITLYTILHLFIITDIKKTLKDVSVTLYQLHHLNNELPPVYNGYEYEQITPTGFMPDPPDIIIDDGDLIAGSGDLDGDGTVTVMDIVMLVNIVLNALEYNEAGDVNNDGQNDVLDIVAMVDIVLEGN